jgi:hypothetical protein
MLKRISLCCMLLSAFVVPLSAQALLTPGEASGYSRYTQHDEILQFLSAISARAKTVQVQEIGKTRAVEEYPAQSLLLCVITAEGASRPQQLDRSKPTILITASQHGSEQSAKEAALLIIRDLALGDLKPLLARANFLIVPQANPWGNRFDRRVNELDLDMNRDHIKMESEEVQAIHRVFRAWMPEVTLDVHEQGYKYYRISMGCVSNLNVDPYIEEFSRRVILAAVEEALARDKITFHEYTVTSENMPNDASGADFTDEELARWPQIMRHSTSDINDGRNSLGLYQTFSFIQEAASRYDLQTLAERTRWQTCSIRAFLQTVTDHGPEIASRVRTLRRELLDQSRSYNPANQIHLKMEYRRDPAQPELNMKEFQKNDASVAGTMRVDKKAGEMLLESEIEPWSLPGKQKVVSRVEKDWFPLVAATHSVTRPLGYVIPAKHLDVVETLRLHDVEIMTFTCDFQMEVEGYLAQKVVPSKYDYVPPDTLQAKAQALSILCKKGDFYIPCSQPAANLLPCLLEPESDYGMIRYWKYHLVPGPGEFFAFYRVTGEQSPPVIPYQRWMR